MTGATAPVSSRRPRAKSLRRLVRYWAAKGTVGGLRIAPPPLTSFLLGGVGRTAHRLMPKQRRLVSGQIDRVYADRSPRWRRELTRDVFESLGRNVAEVGMLARRDPEALLGAVETSTPDPLAALAGGGVVVSAHYGAWELLPSWLGARGLPTAVIVRRNREDRLHRLLEELRAAYGVRLIERGDASAYRRVLRAGDVLVLAGDQRGKGRRVAGTFLGLPAWLPEGPAVLADLCSVPLVPMIIRRTAPGRHSVVIGAPVVVDEADRSRRIASMTRRASRWLEVEIERDPSQWAWFHERWKEMPPGTDGDASGGLHGGGG